MIILALLAQVLNILIANNASKMLINKMMAHANVRVVSTYKTSLLTFVIPATQTARSVMEKILTNVFLVKKMLPLLKTNVSAIMVTITILLQRPARSVTNHVLIVTRHQPSASIVMTTNTFLTINASAIKDISSTPSKLTYAYLAVIIVTLAKTLLPTALLVLKLLNTLVALLRLANARIDLTSLLLHLSSIASHAAKIAIIAETIRLLALAAMMLML